MISTAQATINELAAEVQWCDGQMKTKDEHIRCLCAALADVALWGFEQAHSAELVDRVKLLWLELSSANVPVYPLPLPAVPCPSSAHRLAQLELELDAVRSADEATLRELAQDLRDTAHELQETQLLNTLLEQQLGQSQHTLLRLQSRADRSKLATSPLITCDIQPAITAEAYTQANLPDPSLGRVIAQKCAELEEELNQQWESRLAEVCREHDAIARRASAADATAKQVSASVQSVLDELLQLKQLQDETQHKLKLAEAERARLERQVALAQHAHKCSEGSVQELTAARDAMVQQHEASAAALLQEQVQALARVQQLSADVSRTHAELCNAQQELQVRTQEHTSAQAEVQALQATVLKLTNDVRSKSREVDALSAEANTVRSQVRELAREHEEAQGKALAQAQVLMRAQALQHTQAVREAVEAAQAQRTAQAALSLRQELVFELLNSQEELKSVNLYLLQARQEIASLSATLTSVRKAKFDLESAVTRSNTELDACRTLVASVQQESQHLVQECTGMASRIKALEGDLAMCQQQLAAAIQFKEAAEAEDRATKADVHSLLKRHEDKAAEASEYQMKLASVEQRWSAAERNLRLLREQLDAQQHKTETAEAQVAELRSETSQLRVVVAAQEGSERELEVQVSRLEALHESCQAQAQETMQALYAKAEQYDALSNACTDLQQQIASLKEDGVKREESHTTCVQELENTLASAQISARNVEAEKRQLEDQVSEERSACQEWHRQAQALGVELQRLVGLYDATVQQLSEASAQVSQQQSMITEFEDHEESLQAEVTGLRGVAEHAQSLAREMVSEAQRNSVYEQEAAHRTSIEATARLREAERETSSLQDIERSLRAELQTLRTELKQANQLKQRIQLLELQASESRVSLASVSGTLHTRTQSQHALTQQVRALSAELEAARQENSELTQELEQMSDLLIQMESRLRSAQQQVQPRAHALPPAAHSFAASVPGTFS